MIEQALIGQLHSAGDILCVSHVNPDGDAIGSLTAMGWILRHLGKEPVLALQDVPPPEHTTLPGAEDIVTPQDDFFSHRVRHHRFDLIVCLDASSPDRMGSIYNEPVHGQTPLVVIDHHVTNTLFGTINWVAPTCAATCQMLVYLADTLDVPLSLPLAECLLTGLVTDTLCFRTDSTDAAVLKAAMRLIQGGANLAQIAARTVNRRPFSLIHLWSMALPQVSLDEGIIWTTISKKQVATANHHETNIGLSEFLVTADEADMSAVFTEKVENGQPAVECSFRAKPGFDVSRVALSYGGGGHPAASGCTIIGELSAVAAEVLATLQVVRKEQRYDRTGAPRGSQ